MKDPQKRGGGGYAGGGGDVCAWPHRPDGSVREAVRAGAGAVLDEHAAQRGEDGGEASLFASALGSEARSVGSRHRGSPSPSKEKRAPPTKEQMTSILLG